VRILYFSRHYTPHDHRFLSAISGGGNEVFFLRLESSARESENRPLPPGVRAVPWGGGRAPAHWSSYPRLLAGLKKVLRDIQPDLVHAGPVHSVAFLAALSGFQPLVTMSWGSDLLLDAQRSSFLRGITRFVFRRSSVLLADCFAVRDRALQFGFPVGRVVVFPWGVDLDHFSPGAELALRRSIGWLQDFVVLHTRSWEPVYGVDVFARAFISAAGQRADLKLIMLAGGSMENELQYIFSAAGMQDRVKFPGQVGYHELPSYYRSADLYVSASPSDGSSISLLEAMACGLPALVSDIPANHEWVMPGQNGWHFPDGDGNVLAQLMLAAAGARSQLAAMGRAARRTTELRADWTNNTELLLAAYQLALERSKE